MYKRDEELFRWARQNIRPVRLTVKGGTGHLAHDLAMLRAYGRMPQPSKAPLYALGAVAAGLVVAATWMWTKRSKPAPSDKLSWLEAHSHGLDVMAGA